MADKLPALYARNTLGLQEFKTSDGNYGNVESSYLDSVRECRCMAFSKDGSLLAWSSSTQTVVMDTKTREVIYEIEQHRVFELVISPCNTFIATWEPYLTTQSNTEGNPNFNIFNIATQSLCKSFIQKKRDGWQPVWSCDEEFCLRFVNNEIHFYKEKEFGTIANKIYQQNVSLVSVSPTGTPHHIAVYVIGKKGAPSFVRLFRYPNLENTQAIANKSFYKCDRLEMFWNKKGTAVLLLASTEVDTTGSSYYGEMVLHFLSTSGDSSMVSFDKRGPVYSVDWNPNSKEFCAVYGYMPAKATIFNLKCEPIFHFGTGPRNICSYNPHGNSNMTFARKWNIEDVKKSGSLFYSKEFWSTKDKKLANKIQVADTTVFEWCPDGVHFVTATTAPRLRVDNGFKIWHYNGQLIRQEKALPNVELWQTTWEVSSDVEYKEQAVKITQPGSMPVKAAAYRPPGARGTKSMKLHEVEPAQSTQPQNLSAAALKNKKKRESKSKAKNADDAPMENPPAILQQKQQRQQQQQANSAPSQDTEGNDKKIRALKKKIRQVEDLKEKQSQGKQLESNQLEKLKSEKALLNELRQLEKSAS